MFELAQLAGALIGVVLNAYGLVQAVKDSDALSRTGLNGTRKLVATGNVQQELIRLVVQIMLTIAGITSVVLPPPNPDLPEVFLWASYIQRGILVLITFLLAFKSMLDVRDRRALLRLWIEEQDRRRQQLPLDFADRRKE